VAYRVVPYVVRGCIAFVRLPIVRYPTLPPDPGSREDRLPRSKRRPDCRRDR